MNIPKVSVIIPVYKVEQYIERCAISLFSQTLDSIEYIFIDDRSPDKSIEILLNVLENFPERKDQVKLIRHIENYGVGQSRLDGLKASTGEYIIHCDSDDWIDKEMYKKLYQEAKKTNSDIVICDYTEFKGKFIKEISQKININKENFLSQLIRNEVHNGLWNKLIRRELYDKIENPFILGLNLCEDRNIMSRLAYNADKISYLKKPLYHYNRNNNSSYTSNWKKENTESILNLISINSSFFNDKGIDSTPFIEFGLYMIFLNISDEERENLIHLIPKNIDYSIFPTFLMKVYAFLLFNNKGKQYRFLRKFAQKFNA